MPYVRSRHPLSDYITQYQISNIRHLYLLALEFLSEKVNRFMEYQNKGLVDSSGLILVNAHASYYSAEPQWRGTTNSLLPINHDHTAKQLLTL